jgi:hypothetical protein
VIRVLWSLLFEDRLDRMTYADIEAAGEAKTLTFSEVKRLTKLQRYAEGLSR